MSASVSSIPVQKGKLDRRIDGPLKVTGQAMYTSDAQANQVVFGVPVGATIAKGKVKSIDESAARKMRGVLAIYSHGKCPPIYRCTPEEGFASRVDEARPPLEDDVVRYYSQYVAFVVAETFQIAEAAASSLKINYTVEKHDLNHDLKQEDQKKVDAQRGDSQKAFDAAAFKIEHTYTTPPEVHNPIELHSSLAEWNADQTEVLLHETSQAIHNHQNVMAQMLGIPKEKVRVISKFLGSGFGGKLWPWNHSMLAAMAARDLKRPVKLVVDRKMMFTNVGHRAQTQQTIQMAAHASGKLAAIHHSYANRTSMLDSYRENCGELTALLYQCPNVLVTSGLARRNAGTPTSMRGPGAVPGLFALESAIDELAHELKMDPVQLRLINDTPDDQVANRPFSSRHLKECLELGASRFGWDKRNPEIGSMKKDGEILGWGVASCAWQARRLDANASVEFFNDGSVKVSCGTHDIGTGMYTALANIAAEELGIDLHKIEVVLGDTILPPGPIAGGSMATGSVVPAVVKACAGLKKAISKAASENPFSPLHGNKPDELHYHKGRVGKKDARGIALEDLLAKINMKKITGHAEIKAPDEKALKEAKMTTKSFGAQFVEIGWQPEIARLRVRRVTTVIDGGKMINFQQAKNQIEGAIVMGVGMGLFEQMEYDDRYGNPVNNNLADYIVASHADTPEMDVSFLDFPDLAFNEYGARGVGEIGLAGVAPAICNAVFHATGVRVRDLPIKIEDLLKAKT
jgi:xanthine dehydrogenase YagR molybdenum-binding subunit